LRQLGAHILTTLKFPFPGANVLPRHEPEETDLIYGGSPEVCIGLHELKFLLAVAHLL